MYTKPRKRKALKDCNSRLPEDLSPLIRDWLQGLSPSPRNDYLRDQCFSKFVSHDTDPASLRKSRAIDKWLWAERVNEWTEDRLQITHDGFNILPRVSMKSFVSFARDLIVSIIGEMPRWASSTDTTEISFMGIFSGGASTSRKRTESHPGTKYFGKAHVTDQALGLWEDLLSESETWLSYRNDHDGVVVVPGNVMFMVPKNAHIDRCACKEPDINMYMQKGLGGEIRRGLRAVGINLNDQSINRRLAKQGSIDGSLATLDLSSASDSVTCYLVELLLPPIWYSSLAALRCETTIIDGEAHRNVMFSSMGNGFTFELESLLFYALARTTAYFEGVRGVISVYGDDIICPTELAAPLMEVLYYFGFSVNPEKSYWSGPFRESCGGHYYNGRDITPFYVRKPVESLVDLIHLANSLYLWASRDAHGILDPEAEDLWFRLRDMVPARFWGGQDPADKTALVTGHAPRKRLVSVTRDLPVSQRGLYLLWLNATLHRSSVSVVETSLVKSELPLYRVRPNKVIDQSRTLPSWWRDVRADLDAKDCINPG